MGKHTNVIAFILSAFFMFGAIGTISVYAEGEVEPYPGYSEPIFEPATDPVYTESPYEPEPVYTDPPYDPGSSSVDPAPYNPGGDSSNNSSSWNDGGNVYSSNSATEQVYGGVQQSSQISQNNNIQNTTPSASLYNAQGKTINDKTLSSGDWSEIAANLKNADAKAGAGDGDFAFIQQNTSKEDNGSWIIIAGVACLVLSAAGFIYLIASAVMRRKNLRPASAAAFAGTHDGGYRRAGNDYDDGYRASSARRTPPPRNNRNNGRRYK
ncbi:MAG: hypothetical protein IJH96_00485 [Ruminococcus sp.]|nr:hypothetical protein [Ruminococcus sp.]